MKIGACDRPDKRAEPTGHFYRDRLAFKPLHPEQDLNDNGPHINPYGRSFGFHAR